MLCLQFEFVGGHYHATSWGHQVNEATVEWPPSPWRVLRALIAGWHRLDDESSQAEGASMVGKLASCDPSYQLPPYGEGHSRHYMPTRSKPTMVFDAFLTMGEARTMRVGFPSVDLTDGELQLLDRCLEHVRYLGRAESWVTASRGEWVEEGRLIRPGQSASAQLVMGAMSPEQYKKWQQEAKAATRKKAEQPPPDLWSALQMSTTQLQKGRWSSPPGSRDISYDLGELRPERSTRRAVAIKRQGIRVVRYRLVPEDTILPLLHDGLLVGDAMHAALSARSPGRLPDPAMLVGKRDGEPLKDEGHAYILWTGEGAGRDRNRVTHVHVALPSVQPHSAGQAAAHCFDASHLEVIYAVDHLKIRSSADTWPRFRLVVEGEWSARDLAGFSRAPAVVGKGKVWRSVSPVVLHRHPKVRDGAYVRDAPDEQLRRYLARAGFPEAEILPCGDPADWVPFRRRRSGYGSGRQGVGAFGFELRFAEDVRGPIALGAMAHFGLGRFEPV